ncbi:DUF4007 family protein [Myroides odoratimimus]|uniref:DUF4007 family protein n=2 Tax=Myroides odoratimimus TaxID=76832 RepID=UPI002578275A|nr:DUF4007 family protein [Myroides odoratimimus]MDM1508311.1 DUF4007 family protein [Myroides odoratimimus]
MTLKFSGHDTFHCKQQWLLKGYEFTENQGYKEFNQTEKAIKLLGIGRNMVSSLKYWLDAFNITENGNLTPFANYIFSEHNGVDRYLEDEGTLWLLQFYICHFKHASIYNLIFTEYFIDKASYEFNDEKIISFINKFGDDRNIRRTSENTLSTDFKVFIRSYIATKKDAKNIEDDVNSPLLELNLVEKVDSKGDLYRINKTEREIPLSILAYCISELATSLDKNVIDINDIQNTIANYFCMTNESLQDHLIRLNTIKELSMTYSDTAGNSNVSIKNNSEDLKKSLLNNYYEIQ